jgi:hypothetical protein
MTIVYISTLNSNKVLIEIRLSVGKITNYIVKKEFKNLDTKGIA